jgi:uncharacterized membrane protein YjjP (DUF1212 family)
MELQPIDVEDGLDFLAKAGALMLENGAATYRVDETLTRLGSALGLEHVEVFATPTGLVLEANTLDGRSATKVARVRTMSVNMNRLARLSNLSREASANGMRFEDMASRLHQIEQEGSLYPDWMVIVGVCIACGAFALLFGGGWREVAATLLGAAVGMLVRIRLRPVRLVPLMITAAAAFAATATGSWGCRMLGCTEPEVVPIAAVLQLVPGVPIVTAVIDLATGDIISGVARGAYASVIAVGIALGMLLFLVWGL